MGVNADGKEEFYVEDMPNRLTLLCAHAYCQDGCAVLFEDGGLVFKMTRAELAALKVFLSSYPVEKQLIVDNQTYEVDSNIATPEALMVIDVDDERNEISQLRTLLVETLRVSSIQRSTSRIRKKGY